MRQFDMASAWDDTILLLRSHTTLTIAIAAVFLFLPSLAFSWFGPLPVEPPTGASFDQVMAAARENLIAAAPGFLVSGLLAAVGSIAILRLWLARGGLSVGNSLIFALTMLPTMIAVQLLTGFMMGVAVLLFVIPFLYLLGRLSVVSPVVADLGMRNPITVIQKSWELTRDNGWMIFLFLFLIGLVILIAALLLGSLGMLFGGLEAARLVRGAIEAFTTAAAGWVSAAVSAAIYRQLSTQSRSEVFS